MQEGDIDGGEYGGSTQQNGGSEPANETVLAVARIPGSHNFSSPDRGQHMSQSAFNSLVSPQSQTAASRGGGNGSNSLSSGVGEGALAAVSAPVYMAHAGELLYMTAILLDAALLDFS